MRWNPGDVVALRYVTRAGQPGMRWPAVVARDDDLVALWIPKGTAHRRWGAGRELVEVEWRHDMLRLMVPDAHHSTWLFWDDGRFMGWYVNVEEPFRRTPIGFDTNDHQLDVVVDPDLSWRLKDEDVLESWVRRGIYSKEFAEAVRAEAERVVEAVERRGSPFCDGWEKFTPDPAWPVPVGLPEWDDVPATLWDRRDWAYLQR